MSMNRLNYDLAAMIYGQLEAGHYYADFLMKKLLQM